MARFNVERVQGYTIMSNYHLRDNRLSMKAKGLMSVMLSLPPEWDYSLRGLAAISRENVNAIGSMVKELEECGYIERYQERDASGKLGGAVYNLYEKPKAGAPRHDSPCPENPYTVNPYPEKPCTENEAQLNKYKLNTKKSSKEVSNTQSINPAPSGESKNDWIDRIDETRALVKENIEYDVISGQYDKEQLDEIVEIMTEVICTSRDMVTVGKQDMPAEAVRSRCLSFLYAYGLQGGNSMCLSKYEKETILLTSEGDDFYDIQVYDSKLKRRLTDFATKYPDLCRITRQDPDGCIFCIIDKSRVSIRLIPPYSDERKNAAREIAKKLSAKNQSTSESEE